MKVKEGIAWVNQRKNCKNPFDAMIELYKQETLARVELRNHGKREVSVELMKGIVREMDDWIFKIAIAMKFDEVSARAVVREAHDAADNAMKLAVAFHTTYKAGSSGA